MAALALAAPLAQAQTGASTPDRAVRLAEGVLLYPSVKLSLGHDDNVRAAPTDTVSARVSTLAPALKLDARNGTGIYGLSYGGAYSRYSGLSADNTNNHDLGATGAHEFSARSRLNWGLGYQNRYDARADAVVASAAPDRWQGNNLNALYSYGARQAQGRLEAEVSANRKRYQNNKLTTQGSDVDTRQIAGRYFWRLMPSTYLVTEARAAANDYRVGTANNNTDTRLLAGVTWEATAKTSGSIKVGQQRKNFDSAAKGDVSKATYEASVEWKPLSYSVFALVARRSAEDTLAEGDYNQNRSLGLTWSHQWSEAVGSRVGVADASADFVNSARRDDTRSTSLGLTYGLNRHFTLGLDVMRTQRDSTLAPNNHKRNTVLLSVSAAL